MFGAVHVTCGPSRVILNLFQLALGCFSAKCLLSVISDGLGLFSHNDVVLSRFILSFNFTHRYLIVAVNQSILSFLSLIRLG